MGSCTHLPEALAPAGQTAKLWRTPIRPGLLIPTVSSVPCQRISDYVYELFQQILYYVMCEDTLAPALLKVLAAAPAHSPPCSACPMLLTCRTNQSQAAHILWVLRGINPSNIPTHGGADEVEGPLVKLDALHKLHRSRRSIVRAEEAKVWCPQRNSPQNHEASGLTRQPGHNWGGSGATRVPASLTSLMQQEWQQSTTKLYLVDPLCLSHNGVIVRG